MQKFFLVVLSFTIILCFNANVHAQLVKVGVGGGITQVSGPDFYTTEVADHGLGFSTEYNFGAVAKINLPLIPLTPRAFAVYHKLSGEGKEETSGPGGGLIEVDREYSQSILSLGAGVQYGFIPVPVGVDPYLSLDLTFNNFGDFTTTTDGSETTSDGVSRFGLQFGVGAEVSIIPAVNVDVFAGYKIFNIIGKEDGEETISAINVDLFIMFNFI